MSSDHIVIRGARQHNLKNIDLDLPRNRLVVITGLSGSGKSTLAFDTLYAEGQRRYVESLSAYARQFLERMEKPDVDFIEGLSPAIAIEQKSAGHNPRSTVGTVTEIQDYLRLLFARAGVAHCLTCGRPIAAQSIDSIIDAVMDLGEGARIMLLAPVAEGARGSHAKLIKQLRKDGFARLRVDGQIEDIEAIKPLDKNLPHDIEVVVDRLALKPSARNRLADSLELALSLSDGVAKVARLGEKTGAGSRKAESTESGSIESQSTESQSTESQSTESQSTESQSTESQSTESQSTESQSTESQSTESQSTESEKMASGDEAPELLFSEKAACVRCGTTQPELTPAGFSFNSPRGACPRCDGLGVTLELAPDRIIPDPQRSIRDGAIAPWASRSSVYYAEFLDALTAHYQADIYTPFSDLPDRFREVLLYGSGEEQIPFFTERSNRRMTYRKTFEGLIPSLRRRYLETESPQTREEIRQYMDTLPCPECGGARLNAQARSVTVAGHSLADITSRAISDARTLFDGLAETLPRKEAAIASRIIREISGRLGFLDDVGLSYLSLDRRAETLSGGESQRIRLATQIGSRLSGVLYVLDEPSIGLHQRDNRRLLSTLLRMRDLGNTVLVVEHDEETIRAADFVVDMGPGAGMGGGEVVFAGPPEDLAGAEASLTGQYFAGGKRIPVPAVRRSGNGRRIVIEGAAANNLKSIDVAFPLGCFICVTGVSGSGKSSLVLETLHRAAAAAVYRSRTPAGPHRRITGIEHIDKVVNIDQAPIGRTPRSNPATYAGLFTPIRELFARTQEARARGYRPGRFSFNMKGGRCEACGGDGIVKIEMHFLPDIYVTCDVCHGRRYNRETLEIRYKGKTIAEALDMTVSQSLAFFEPIEAIRIRLATLAEVGLGYLRLGQPATTLSGGEAQRVKLSRELSRKDTGQTLYILDEPTTGLHIDDIHRLLNVLNRLVDMGNTVIVIEHHLDVIKSADYVIDLGPEGGDAGGRLVVAGTPEAVARAEGSHTGRFLAPLL